MDSESCSGALKVHNHCPSCSHRKDLGHPGTGQLEQDCKKLQKRQRSEERRVGKECRP